MIRKTALAALLAAGLVGCDSKSNTPAPKGDGGKAVMDDMKNAAQKGMAAAGDKAKEMGDKAKEMADKGKEMAADAAAKLKETVLKPVTEAMPKIEEKIKGMTGDAAVKAKDAYEALKKLVSDFTANPSDELGKKLTAAFDAVKKMVGL